MSVVLSLFTTRIALGKFIFKGAIYFVPSQGWYSTFIWPESETWSHGVGSDLSGRLEEQLWSTKSPCRKGMMYDFPHGHRYWCTWCRLSPQVFGSFTAVKGRVEESRQMWGIFKISFIFIKVHDLTTYSLFNAVELNHII